MNKSHPVKIRQSLELADALKQAGIAFVPIPIINDEDEFKLKELFQEKLKIIESET